MTGRHGSADGPEDVDAAFAEIVAELEREGVGVRWPEDLDAVGSEPTPPAGLRAPDPATETPTRYDRRPVEPPSDDPTRQPGDTGGPRETPNPPPRPQQPRHAADRTPPRRPEPPAPEPAPDDDDDHFIPPEPPPLPPLRAGTIGALALFAIGILLLVVPGVIGLAPRIGTPLGLIALSGGVGWLVLRMRQGPPPDSGWDDGAVL